MKLEKVDNHLNTPRDRVVWDAFGNEIAGTYVEGWQVSQIHTRWGYWDTRDDGPAHRWVYLEFILREGN